MIMPRRSPATSMATPISDRIPRPFLMPRSSSGSSCTDPHRYGSPVLYTCTLRPPLVTGRTSRPRLRWRLVSGCTLPPSATRQSRVSS